MCGIAGWFGPTSGDTGLLARMADRLVHRGPDASGREIVGDAHFAHRRLSILDLEASRQPMLAAAGDAMLTYNGELYNYRELREELEGRGHAFRTSGDTEVVLEAYRAWGDDCLSRLRGMFAFAVYDRERDRILLARDHLGVKPLYYSFDGRTLVFASELKALIEHPAVAREVDLDAVSLYLESQYIPSPRSIWKSVRKLEPAHSLVLAAGGEPRIERFWRASFASKHRFADETEAVDALEEVLRRSVRSMLMSDVPLGAFLSGGVDSSTLVALMAEERGGDVDTFNLGFTGDHGLSEHDVAAEVAAHLGVRHRPLMIEPDDVLGELERSFAVYDEPFGDQAALPTLLLSRLTREHVTVVLTGEGGDEVQGGYRAYETCRGAPGPLDWLRFRGSPLPPLLGMLPGSLRRERVVRNVIHPPGRRYASQSKQFREEHQGALYTKAFRSARHEVMRDYGERFYDECDAAEYVDRMLAIDTQLWLPDDLLTKVDRATMAYSLEARVPHLDHEVVEFSAGLPVDLKVRPGVTKYLLKRVAERHLPKEIIYRRKQGFEMPLDDWLRGGLSDLMKDSLGEGGLGRRGLLKPARIRRMVSEHVEGKRNLGRRLWTLIMLEQWFRRFAPEYRLG